MSKEINEDAGAVTSGAGQIAGLGTGNQPEPGYHKSTILKRKTFAGNQVFEVNSDFYHNSQIGKLKYHQYEQYVSAEGIGQQIREYGKENPDASILIQNEQTGAIQFLRYGKK